MEKSTILIVDDNTTNLNVLLGYLSDQGYKVLISTSGEQALKQMTYIKPGIILLDIMMTGIDGFETCRRLKADGETRDIPVIFMTALTDTVDKIKGFEAGGVDYITKPLQYEEVLARIKTHLTIRGLQQELQEKNEELKALNASKDKFFSIIAHDLRNPLGALREIPQIIIEHLEEYSKKELMEMITLQRDAAQNLSALLENLLTWSRVQRGMIEQKPQPIAMNDMIARNVILMTPAAAQKQITLKNLLKERIIAYADYTMTDTVLRNLMSNAVKFTPNEGIVEVSARQDVETIEISVADTGIGISEKYLPKLFHIDHQYRRTGTNHERGTGLGLILCQEFIERNGGSIGVESEVGKGSIFRFTLPKAENV